MRIDAHCHAWHRWPYQPAVPDATSRSSAANLIYEMDRSGVKQAVLIAAAIGDNRDNTDYAFKAAADYPGRFVVFPDLECWWSSSVGQPGAAARLEAALSRFPFRGFSLYLAEDEDGSRLADPDMTDFFRLVRDRGLIASLSVMPHQIEAVIQLANRIPEIPILLHHFAFLGPRSRTGPGDIEAVIAAAACSNIYVKYSGMGNIAASDHEYPYSSLRWIPECFAQAFGPDRMLWGSDWPVSTKHMTYPQSLSLLTRHGPFRGEDLSAVLGRNMHDLLNRQPNGAPNEPD